MIKLSVYQIVNGVVQWIHRFLFDRIQIVAVYDERGDLYSTPAYIKSGASQETKLGPILFNVCVNDAFEVVKNGLELYVDDFKLSGLAASTENCPSLQDDLNNLCLWATTWMLKFNPCKCKVLHLSPNNPCHSYHMVDSVIANMPIESANEECDLGVTIDDKLKFHSHYQNQAAKANKVLDLNKPSVTSHQPRVIKKL